jgi:hypothetical protein
VLQETVTVEVVRIIEVVVTTKTPIKNNLALLILALDSASIVAIELELLK